MTSFCGSWAARWWFEVPPTGGKKMGEVEVDEVMPLKGR